ncbi:hypothetical protein [Mesobacillus maritimus]|uniref:Uncharacterized protein n=1 Tax=Mesobacillus maritimus TaxID=1643336 RepID=A0ABS7K4V4_9BACI|nr:hypothetical protein [Mesobacillus maritimus]MBY0097277.1 hypothetical protein [Mesobacillus maritimus]
MMKRVSWGFPARYRLHRHDEAGFRRFQARYRFHRHDEAGFLRIPSKISCSSALARRVAIQA